MEWPKIYRYQGRWWWGGFDQHGNKGGWRHMAGELFWLLRNGKFHTGWQWPELVFGLGRTWHDGPIWFAHLGVWSVDLAPD